MEMKRIVFLIAAITFGLMLYAKTNEQMWISKELRSDESYDGVAVDENEPMMEEAKDKTVSTGWSSYLPRGAGNGYILHEFFTSMLEKKIAEYRAKLAGQILFYVTVMKCHHAADKENASCMELQVFLLNFGGGGNQEQQPIANATSDNDDDSVVATIDDVSFLVNLFTENGFVTANDRLVLITLLVLIILHLQSSLLDLFDIYYRRFNIGNGNNDFNDNDNDDDDGLLKAGLSGDDSEDDQSEDDLVENGLLGGNKMDFDKFDVTKMFLVPMTG